MILGTRQIVALFGESLFMDMVEACLAGGAQVGIVRIHPSVPEVASRLQALQPHAVIIDLKAPNLDFVTAVLAEQPAVPIFCLDVTCKTMLVLTGHPYTIRSVDQLLAIVEQYIQSDRSDGSNWRPSPAVPYAVDFEECVTIQTEGER